MTMKRPGIEREDKREPMRDAMPSLKMRAKPNWIGMDSDAAGPNTDRLHIDPDQVPQGMSALWVTDSCLGRPETQHRSDLEKSGWTPVHQEDFDGQFDGRWMPKGADGEIKVDASVLMMRPKELTDAAKLRDAKAARDQVRSREDSLTGEGATQGNRISKSYERISIPED